MNKLKTDIQNTRVGYPSEKPTHLQDGTSIQDKSKEIANGLVAIAMEQIFGKNEDRGPAAVHESVNQTDKVLD